MNTTSIWDFGAESFENGLLLFLLRSTITIVLAYLFAKLVRKMCMQVVDKTSKRNSMPLLYVYNVIRFIICLLAAMEILNRIKPLQGIGAGLLGATGLMTVVVGLAAQATFGNFISGVVISVTQPFHVDDFITLPSQNVSGTVELITFRHTVIKTIENTRITIPNSLMDNAVIEDKAYGQMFYRKWDSLTVSFDTDLDLLKKIITEEIDKIDALIDVRTEEEKQNGLPKTPVRFNSFAKEGIEAAFPMVTRTYSDYFQASSSARENILKALQKSGITVVSGTFRIIENKA